MKIEIISCSQEKLDYLKRLGIDVPKKEDTLLMYIPENHYEYMCYKIKNVIDTYSKYGGINDIIDGRNL